MQVARRVYLYLISFISLMMVLIGASNLLRLLLERLLGLTGEDMGIFDGDYWRDQYSLWGAMLVVGGIVWAIHWVLAQRAVSPSNPNADEERGSALRKLFIYGVLAVALVQTAVAASVMIMALLRPFAVFPSESLSLVLSGALPQLLVFGTAWLYHWYVRVTDNRATPEEGRSATLRRWYFYGVSYVALTVMMIQLVSLARYIWHFSTDPSHPWLMDSQWIPPIVAGATGWILVWGAVWVLHWTAIQRHTAVAESEQRSPLRKVYLYGMTLQTVVFTLGNLAFFLYNLMRVLWGTDPVADTGQPLLTAAGDPVLSALIYGAFWFYHWQVIKWNAFLLASEQPVQAAIRQLYHYLVALIGMGMLAAGIVNMLRLLIDQWFGGADIISMSAQAWGDQISFVATTIITGGIAWFLNWLIVEREALSPGGEMARHSLPRRLYLFMILLVTVTSLLGSAAWLIYQVLRNFGNPMATWADSLSWALSGTITAAILLAYHLYILIIDQRARAAFLASIPAPPVLAPAALVPATILLMMGDAAVVQKWVAEFQAQVPEGIQATVFPASGITPADVNAWLLGRVAATPTPRTPPTPQAGQPTGVKPVPA